MQHPLEWALLVRGSSYSKMMSRNTSPSSARTAFRLKMKIEYYMYIDKEAVGFPVRVNFRTRVWKKKKIYLINTLRWLFLLWESFYTHTCLNSTLHRNMHGLQRTVMVLHPHYTPKHFGVWCLAQGHLDSTRQRSAHCPISVHARAWTKLLWTESPELNLLPTPSFTHTHSHTIFIHCILLFITFLSTAIINLFFTTIF